MRNHWAWSIAATPGVWLGLGLGAIGGFVLASGFAFSSEESARFLGGLLGSLIAVASAVSLYYLKDRDEIRRARAHILKIADFGYTQAENCAALTKQDDMRELAAGLVALSLSVNRMQKFLDRFQFSDDKISEAAVCFDKNFAAEFEEMATSDNLASKAELSERMVDHTMKCFGTVISVLRHGTTFGPTAASERLRK